MAIKLDLHRAKPVIELTGAADRLTARAYREALRAPRSTDVALRVDVAFTP
ncbi:hypothetical protein [Caulobacter sp. Root655]|uniref:hypothetical protein n=1 Tax=Caulobacter sp. Root655 TaxID=1736578 RepID=UPI0012E3621C|nr:hypothetical protein [Caulobacter sp. Root655]